MKSAPTPLPSLDEQAVFVAAFDASLDAARKLCEQAVSIRSRGWKDFEAAVYASEDGDEHAGHILPDRESL